MARKVALLAATVVLLSALGIAPAGATNPTPAGSISCTFGSAMPGVVSLKPGLGDTPSAKQIKVKSIIGTANGTSCDNSGVTAGTSKFPISAMTVKITAKTPVGGDCSTLLTAPGLTGKVQVKFLGLNPASKLATVAVVNTTIATTTASAAPPSIQIVTAPSTKGAFVGQTLTFTLNISGLTGGCTDADPLTAVSGTGTVTSP
jgi:hypothetical protein